MEEERDRSQFKHVCKLCNKRYPSGKSLGGHMRSHVIANAQKAKALLKNKAPIFDADFDDVDDDEEREKNGGGHSGYGLRENPKKTWRAANHNNNGSNNNNQNNNYQQEQQQERVCKQCGKAFQSVKALCGHMSSHSERERNFKDDDEEDDRSWSSESHSGGHNNNIINNNNNNNNNLDYNSLSSKRQTRSSYSRYRSLTTSTTLDSLSNNSEIDQHEQEEVAICLMMLSRDHHHHHHHHHQSYSSPQKTNNYFNFTAESSDNNSVILEGGSSSNHAANVGKRKDLNLMNNNKFKQVGISQKLNVAQEMDNSDSGYFENGAKELESDDSVDGYFVKNYYYYSSYGTNKNPNYKADQFGSGLVDSSDGSKKRVRDLGGFSFESPESEGNSSKKIKQDFFHESSNNHNHNPQKGSEFECGKCSQTFKTYQALGGHIISTHRKNGENSLETSNYAKKGGGGGGGSSKKVKGHKCPYCPKVFKSGQALGGHKRSHMMGGGGPSLRAPPPEPEPEPEASPTPTPPPMIDLNLPAPLEEEASGNSEFVAW